MKKAVFAIVIVILIILSGCEKTVSGGIVSGPTGGEWMVLKGGASPVYLTEVKTPSNHKYCVVISSIRGGYSVAITEINK